MINHKKPLYALSALLAAIIFLAFGCTRFIRAAPSIEKTIPAKADLAFMININEIPKAETFIQSNFDFLKNQLQKKIDTQDLEALDSIKLELNGLSVLGGYAYGLPELNKKNIDKKDAGWMVGIECDKYIPAFAVIETINHKNQFNAILGEKINQFQLISLNDHNGKKQIELALFSGRKSQIRIGNKAAIEDSIRNNTEKANIREDMKLIDNQMWAYLKIPEGVREKIAFYESKLPVETGTLASGLKTGMFSMNVAENETQTGLTLEFDDINQANIAFSYIQMALTFALKPYINKVSDGELKTFLKSIHNRNHQDLVMLNCRLNEQDIIAFKELFSDDARENALKFVLDLI